MSELKNILIPDVMLQLLAFLAGVALFLLSYAVSGPAMAYVSLVALCFILLSLYLPLQDPTEPAYILLGVVVFYFFPRQLLLIFEGLPLMGHLAPADFDLMRYGNLIVSIGVLAFHFTYRFSKTVRLLPNLKQNINESNLVSSCISALVVSFVSLGALAFIVRSSGADLGALQGESQQILKQGALGYAYNVLQWLPLCSLLLVYQFSGTRWKVFPVFHIVVLILATMVLTRREPLIILAFGLMAFYGLSGAISRLRFSVISIFILLLFVLVGYMRVAAQTGGLDFGAFLLAYFYVGEFWVYDMFLVILREAGSMLMPFRHGLDLIPGFFDNFHSFTKLPDAAIGDQLGELLNPAVVSRAGIPPSIFGMLYLNYSIIGVVLGLAVLGVIAGMIEQLRRGNSAMYGWMLIALAYTWLGYIMRNASPYNTTLLIVKLLIGMGLIFLIKALADFALLKGSYRRSLY